MNLYDLGSVPWLDSQLIYHALPRLGREGLVILAPASPYVCIGYHQDLAQEVDVEFCQAHGIPIFRREVGGGAVYLDGDQLFYQIIIHRDNPQVPGSKEAFYRKFLQPVVETYRELGLPAQYRPVNDIIVRDRKISGTGAGEIGECLVLVGNVIMDFNYGMMARVLKVPDEKFRDKVYKSMQENLTTLKRELGHVPPLDHIKAILVARFERLLGPLEAGQIDPPVREMVQELAQRFQTPEWLYRKSRPVEGRRVRIATGAEVRQGMYKAPGGLIRATTETKGGKIVSVSLSGDFFFYPEGELTELEEALVGVEIENVEEAIARFYRQNAIESPGLQPADLARVLVS